jgi:hypothetical protein
VFQFERNDWAGIIAWADRSPTMKWPSGFSDLSVISQTAPGRDFNGLRHPASNVPFGFELPCLSIQ